MKDRTQANITNEESHRQAEALTDLPVADERANQTKAGGYDSLGRLYSVTDASKY